MLKKNIVEEDFADFNYIVFEGPKQDYNEITIALETPPMMAQKRCFSSSTAAFSRKPAKRRRLSGLRRLKTVPDYAVIAFYEEEVDKRSVLYKAAAKAGEAVECAYLEGVELINWVGRGCREAGKGDYEAGHRIFNPQLRRLG